MSDVRESAIMDERRGSHRRPAGVAVEFRPHRKDCIHDRCQFSDASGSIRNGMVSVLVIGAVGIFLVFALIVDLDLRQAVVSGLHVRRRRLADQPDRHEVSSSQSAHRS